MLLRATEKTWGPRHAVLDDKTHKIVSWTHGRWSPEMEPVEWPVDLSLAPDSLMATNEADQRILDDLRERRDAETRIKKRKRMHDTLRAELKAEIEAQIREEMKEELRREIANQPKVAVAEPEVELPIPVNPGVGSLLPEQMKGSTIIRFTPAQAEMAARDARARAAAKVAAAEAQAKKMALGQPRTVQAPSRPIAPSAEQVVRRRGGRPKGSKNKPKAPAVESISKPAEG